MSTYSPIATQTLSSATSSLTFSSIPQGYTDLVVVANRLSSAVDNLSMQFNGDTGSNYSFTVLYGTGSTAGSARGSNTNNPYLDYYAASESTFAAPVILNIQNYANSTTYKTTLARGSNASRGVDATAMLWRSTSAITSILLKCHDGSNFASGSTFSLYGIQVGNAAQKAQGGNIVTSDGTYVYHTFTSSGSFTPSQALTVDYLVVAGGGGGGGRGSGGGGAGGYRTSIGGSPLSLTAKPYVVTIGGGGAGGSGTNTNDSLTMGVTGFNSTFASITSAGGGGGGGTNGQDGLPGGSGGGAGANYTPALAGAGNTPATTPSQGNNGGTNPVAYSTAPGGGGAGAVGGNSSSGSGGAGGAGSSNSISGTSITYAGGGGGGCWDNKTAGAGGSGGGGAGGTNNVAGTAGTVNLGGGGGGGGHIGTGGAGSAGGNGGSGVVIIRYAL